MVVDGSVGICGVLFRISDGSLVRYGGEGQTVIDINWYQSQAMRTCSVKDPAQMCINSALGLAGEAGEYCELIKKHLYQGHGLADERLAEEIGDVLWYCAEAATSLGLKLGDIAKQNVDKLWRRYPTGFDSVRSEQRGPENWCGEQPLGPREPGDG